MINVRDKKECVGCTACAQSCSFGAIVMTEDSEGFLYPAVQSSVCTGCGECKKVCPLQTPEPQCVPTAIYAAFNRDEAVRMKSSSGGVFFALSQSIIERSGVVYGAAFDEQFQVKHRRADSMTSCETFRGSKYVQSFLGDTFQAVRADRSA